MCVCVCVRACVYVCVCVRRCVWFGCVHRSVRKCMCAYAYFHLALETVIEERAGDTRACALIHAGTQAYAHSSTPAKMHTHTVATSTRMHARIHTLCVRKRLPPERLGPILAHAHGERVGQSLRVVLGQAYEEYCKGRVCGIEKGKGPFGQYCAMAVTTKVCVSEGIGERGSESARCVRV